MKDDDELQRAARSARHNPKRASCFSVDGEMFVIVGKDEWDLRVEQSARVRLQDWRMTGRYRVD